MASKKQFSIVRCDRSGVFFGVVKTLEGQKAVLTDVRNIHYWEGAASVMQLATDGVSKPERCRFTVSVPEILVTDVIQIVPCTAKATKILKEVKDWRV